MRNVLILVVVAACAGPAKSPAATAIVDAFNNGSPVFTRDGKRVVFTSNRDGLPQLYIADIAKLDTPVTRLPLRATVTPVTSAVAGLVST